MSRYTYLLLTLFLSGQGKLEAARSYRPDTLAASGQTFYAGDSLHNERPPQPNHAAVFSAITAVSSAVFSIAGIAAFNVFLFILGGVLGIAAFISGVTGLRRSRKYFREKVAGGEKPYKSNSGRVAGILGTVIGSIVSFIFIIMLVSIAAYSCS